MIHLRFLIVLWREQVAGRLERWVLRTNSKTVWRVITVLYVLMVVCIWFIFRRPE